MVVPPSDIWGFFLSGGGAEATDMDMDQDGRPTQPNPHEVFTRKLTEALHELTDAEDLAPGLMVTEWVFVAAAHGWDNDGDEVAQVVVEPHGSESRVLGLVEHARQRMHMDIASTYSAMPFNLDDDDD